MYKGMNCGLMLAYMIIIAGLTAMFGSAMTAFLRGLWIAIQQYIAMM